MPMTFRDFPLRISAFVDGGRQYLVRIDGQIPGGTPAFDELERVDFDPAVFHDQAADRNLLELLRGRKISESQLMRFGSVLAGLLLPGSVRARLEESLDVMQPRGWRLRLRLMIDEPELAALPWEYLYLKPPGAADSRKYFLALQPDISIVRHESLDEAEPDGSMPAQVRLVGALASPAGLEPLEVEKDREAIQELIDSAALAHSLEPVWVEQATRRSLFEALREPSQIFHFSGHGTYEEGKGYLILEKVENRRPDRYSGEELGELLRNAGVRLAVLGACETAQRSRENLWTGVAPILVQNGVGAVVASQFTLQDKNALPLIEELYRGVLAGEAIDHALQKARLKISQLSGLENRDWGAPVLYLRLHSGVLFPAAALEKFEGSEKVVFHITQNIGVNEGTVTSVEIGSISDLRGDSAGGAVAREIPRLAPPPLQVPLIGREDELAEALPRLKQGAKFYVYGSFGIGKTSLANELFRRAREVRTYSDGHIWGNLAGMDAEKALEWIGSRLNEEAVSRAVGQRAKIDALREVLSRRSDLLIGLDEVPDAAVARAVLEASGDCPVILNGGKRMELSGLAQELELEPLSEEEAFQLFLLQAELEEGKLDEAERKEIRSIVNQLRRLPLAVKLAAGKYAEGESLSDIEERLRYQPDTLFINDPGLNAIFNALYQDLQNDPTAMRMLLRIASFPALECSTDYLKTGETRQAYFNAKDKLMLMGIASPAGRERLALHPVLGLGVWRAEEDLMQEERARSTAWLMDLAKKNRDNYDVLEEEHANLTGLLDFFTDEERWDELVDLMGNLFEYLRVRAEWQEAFERLEAAIGAGDEALDPWKRGWVTLHRGILHTLRANYTKAMNDLDRADQLFEASGDQAYRGKVLSRKGNVSYLLGDYNGARQHLELAIQWMGDKAPPRDRATAHTQLAGILVEQGDLAEAQTHYNKALDLGDPEVKARVHMAMAELERRAGRGLQAQRHLEEALRLVCSLGHVLQQATLEQQLGYVHYYEGRYDQAQTCFEGALATYQELDYQHGIALSLHALGNIYFAQKDLASARRHYEEALAINERLGHRGNVLYNQYSLALIAQRSGEIDQARAAYGQILAEARNLDDVFLQSATLTQMGSLAYEQGEQEEARFCFEQVRELVEQIDDLAVKATVLYYTGLLQAQEGYRDRARESLDKSHSAFAALRSLDAERVRKVLEELEGGEAEGERDIEIDVVVRGTGTLSGAEEALEPRGGLVFDEEIDLTVRGGPFSGEHDEVEEE